MEICPHIGVFSLNFNLRWQSGLRIDLTQVFIYFRMGVVLAIEWTSHWYHDFSVLSAIHSQSILSIFSYAKVFL